MNRNLSKTGKRVAAVGLTVACLAISMTFASPASAHQRDLWHGADLGRVYSTHQAVYVEDRECDGNYVRVTYSHSNRLDRVTDANGCQPGGATVSVPDGVDRFLLCEINVGCTVWVTP